MPHPSPTFSLKDQLFNRNKVDMIAGQITRVYPQFDHIPFVNDTVARFSDLELKERINWISDQLKTFLPSDYNDALRILLASLPAECDPTLSDNDFGDFIYAPYAHFVAKWGCNAHDLETSLNALEIITTRFSAEDAIRYFINAFPTESLAKMIEWTIHHHYHVRRLASEGSRPKLPWSQKINLSISDTLPILNALYKDKTRYVTRSVANHLNDISKLDPQLTIDLLSQWKQTGRQTAKELSFIITHSLRTLIKKGHPDAMKLLNFSPSPQVTLSDFRVISPTIQIGDSMAFEFVVTSTQHEAVVIDYTIHFQNKSGQMSSKKTYKFKQLTLAPGAAMPLSKLHPFRANMTTRTLYPGPHQVDLHINGTVVGTAPFNLKN